jgi:hypothetical protein
MHRLHCAWGTDKAHEATYFSDWIARRSKMLHVRETAAAYPTAIDVTCPR